MGGGVVLRQGGGRGRDETQYARYPRDPRDPRDPRELLEAGLQLRREVGHVTAEVRGSTVGSGRYGGKERAAAASSVVLKSSTVRTAAVLKMTTAALKRSTTVLKRSTAVLKSSAAVVKKWAGVVKRRRGEDGCGGSERGHVTAEVRALWYYAVPPGLLWYSRAALW
eukprot:1371128-Rhodomonas_salina.1